jgi:hypothetical protein
MHFYNTALHLEAHKNLLEFLIGTIILKVFML